MARKPPPFKGRKRRPNLRSALPYHYAKVTRQGAPLFRRKPTAGELKQVAEAAAGRGRWPRVVQRRMKGIYILALDREERVAGQRLYRTIRGQYVLSKDLAHKRAPKMRGVNLRQRGWRLPLAFVHRRGAKRYLLQKNRLRVLNTAPKQHRFVVHGERRWKKKQLLIGTGRIAMRRQDVRLVAKIKRPKGVPARDRWIHVALGEQTLVAYEGRTPVYATLVASGKKGYATRKGLFRIHKKFVTTTMDATDPIDGFYRIEGVPWTQYYWRSFALHGAYWHDDFGTTRSHGCTNIPPKDARWLFYWSRPSVPASWHARFSRRGTWVYITK